MLGHVWDEQVDPDLDPPAGTFESVATGSAFGCALRTDKSVACWGYDDAGQTAAASSTFTSIAAGWEVVLTQASHGQLLGPAARKGPA